LTDRRHLRVILASQSPRRRDLLDLVRIIHEVRPSDIDERYLPGESPRAHAERLAREKALAIDDAERMLRRLAGRTHVVITAVAVKWRGRIESAAEEVGVTFHPLDDHAIAAYVATGEPMDKAGAYGIQGYGATIVQRVEGDYFAVMGLPLQSLVRLCERLGLRYPFGPLEPA